MKPVWLIESDVYGAEIDPLLAEIRRQGMAVAVVPHRALRAGSSPTIGSQPIAPDACVIGLGTFPFARQIQLHQSWVPGAWCSPENLGCTTYYAHFGRFFLNQHYAFLPGVEAIRQREWLFTVFGRDDTVFARPSGCQKLFVDRLIDRESFASALAPARYDPATLVVIAAPRPIGREWRLVVVGDRLVAASQYALNGSRAFAPDCPAEVRAFAESMLSEVRWRPAPIFLLDVGESQGRSGSWS